MLRRLGWAVVLGVSLFALHHAGVISGALAPPKGFEPAWALRNLDVPQYFTWLEACRRGEVLLPDYHAPWITEPAMFQPILLAEAHTGLPTLAAYYVPAVLGYILAAFALLWACAVFCPGRETRFALVAAMCAVPWRLIGWLIAHVTPLPKALVVAGLLDYSYDTADGLFRGGTSNSLTLSVGTALLLFAMAALGRYAETGRKTMFAALAAFTFLSALLHPFEVFVIVAAALVPLWLMKRWREWLALVALAGVGMSPHLLISFRHAWVRDVTDIGVYPVHPFWILANYGIPFVVLVYLLLLRFRMAGAKDRVLQAWLLATIIVPFLPGAPFMPHLFDGFAYCVGLLLVRRLAVDTKLMAALGGHRRVAWTAAGAVVVVSVASLAMLFVQVWRDGRRPEAEWLLSAVRPVTERPLVEWFRKNAPADGLVLSPVETAPWIATAPVHSFASHDVFGVTYEKQRALAERFYRGEDVKHDLLEAYGVRFVVAPPTLPVDGAVARADVGAWRIFEYPDARMKPYPGLAALVPGRPRSLRTRLMDWMGKK